jgi:hypothetical protein
MIVNGYCAAKKHPTMAAWYILLSMSNVKKYGCQVNNNG